MSDVPETFEPYDGLAEWLRDADAERIDCWHCLSWLANRRRSAVEFLSDAEKKRLASRWACRRGGGRAMLGDAARKKENGITDEELGEWVEHKTVRQQRRNEDDK